MTQRDDIKKALDYLRKKDPENEVLQTYDRRLRSLTTASDKAPGGSITLYDHWKENYSSEGIKEKQQKSAKSIIGADGSRQSKGYAKEMEKRKLNPYDYRNEEAYKRYKDQKDLEEKKAKQQKRTEMVNHVKEGASKALEIIDRPFDAFRTGVNEKLHGHSFWKGAKDGLTGEKNTSGKDLNKTLGFDPKNDKVDAVIANLLGKAVADTLHIGNKKKPTDLRQLGEESLGMGTESLADPTLLLGGSTLKIAKLLGKGRTVKQVAEELKIPVEVVQREFVKGTHPGQEIVDPNALRLDAPKEDPLRFLNGPTAKPQETLGLNEPLYKKTVEGLGKDVQIDGTPLLNAPNKHYDIQPHELDQVHQELDSTFKRRQAHEDEFVKSEMAPYDDMLGRSANADHEWNTSVKQAKEMSDRIKKSYGKISVPEGNWADWGHEVPVQFRANRGTNEGGIDLYTFADNEGFSSVDEAVQFLKNIDQTSKTRLKDLKPADDMKISTEQYQELENAARLKFQQTDTAKGLDAYFEELNNMVKAHQEQSATADPLSFMQSKNFKVKQEPVSYVGKMDPKDMSTVRSEGSYSTRYTESPTGDTLKIQPEQPLEFKTQVESRPFKTQIKQEVPRKDITEKVNVNQDEQLLKDRDALVSRLMDDSLSEKEFKKVEQQIKDIDKNNPHLFSVDNETPLGFKAGTIDSYANSPIAAPETFTSQVKSGKKTLGKTVQSVKTQIGSDTQPFYDLEKDLSKAENVDVDSILPDGTFKAKDSLYKGLRGARRATKAAMHNINKTYKPLLVRLEKAGISRKQFEEYTLAKHANDIMKSNETKLKRKGDIHQELQTIQDAVQNTLDKKEVAKLKKQEAKLLKEMKTLEPYTLPSKATPEFVARTLKMWENNPTMVQAQKEFTSEQLKDLELLYKSGRFTRDEFEAMKQEHPNYISMRRSKDDYEADIRIGQKRDLGSEEDILSPIDSAYMNRIITYRSVAENVAKQKIEKLSQLKGGDQYFKELDIKTATDNQKKNAISFYKDGVEKFYEMPEALKNAYDNLKLNQADDIITKALSSIAGVVRSGSTGYNLDFIIKSVVRESQTPFLTSRTGLHPGEMVLGFLDSFMGENLTKLSGGKFKSYKGMYEELGGHSSGFITMDYTSVNKVTSAMKKGSLGRAWEIVNPLKNIERLGAAVEHAPKLAEFRSAKNKGYDSLDAMFEAMDVFDHADSGVAIRNKNKYIPYLNAAIRGNVRILEQLTKSPKDAAKFMGKGLAYVTLPTLGIYGMRFAPGVSDDQRSRLRNMPEWKRNMFWHMPLPDGDTILAVPKAHLVAQIFANPVERALDAMYDNSNKSAGEQAKDAGLDTLKALTPPNGVAGLSQLKAIYSNYDPFTQMPIEDSSIQHEPDKSKRYNSFTSEPAKWIGDKTNTSPAKVDYLLKSLTGGVGRDLLDTTDNINAKDGSRPSKVNSVTQTLNPFDQFVDDKTGGSGVYDRLFKVKDTNPEAKGYYKSIQDLNKIVKEVRESKSMTSEEKRQEIEDLRQRQKEIGDDALKAGVLKKK